MIKLRYSKLKVGGRRTQTPRDAYFTTDSSDFVRFFDIASKAREKAVDGRAAEVATQTKVD